MLRSTPLTLLLSTLALLSAPAGLQSAPEAAAPDGVEPPEVYYHWYSTTHLEVDYLDDDVPVPRCFNVRQGDLPPSGEARFKVYACTDDVRFYWDITPAFSGKPARYFSDIRSARFRRRGPSYTSPPEVRYDADAQVLVFRPRQRAPWSRSVELEYAATGRGYHSGTLRSRFRLFLPPTR